MTTGGQQPPQIDFFQQSYDQFREYPTNLVFRASYRKVLQSYKKRLTDAEKKLFFNEGTKGRQLDVRFLDYDVALRSKSANF